MVRKLQIMKLRGQHSVPGLHTFRITDAGIQAFSRTLGLAGQRKRSPERRRLSTGSAELDEMMGGGIPEGDSALIAGPSGTGNSLLATEFIMAGLRAGEAGIITIFEERPEEYVDRAMVFGLDLRTAINEKKRRWGTEEMGDRGDGGQRKWGTEEMGDRGNGGRPDPRGFTRPSGK